MASGAIGATTYFTRMEQFGNVSESRRLLPRHSSTSGTVTVAMGMHAEAPM